MSEQQNAPVAAAQEEQLDENQIMAHRREKLTAIRAEGIAFPNDFKRDAFAGDLHQLYDEFDKDVLAEKAIPVKVAGRIMLKRHMGKASFATIQDMTGRIQLYINNQGVGEQVHDTFKHGD